MARRQRDSTVGYHPYHEGRRRTGRSSAAAGDRGSARRTGERAWARTMLRRADRLGTLDDDTVRLAGVSLRLAVCLDPPPRVHGPAALAGPGRRRAVLPLCAQCSVRPVRAPGALLFP